MPRYDYLMQAEAGYCQITGKPARCWMRSAHPDKPHLKMLASPLRLDGQRPRNRAAPLLGADSKTILAELGCDADEIAGFRQSGVI